MKDLTFEEFENRVKNFWRGNMEQMGYECPDVFDSSLVRDSYSATFTRFDPRTQRRVYTLDLSYEDGYGFEVTEHFAELSDIPPEYGDMHEDKNKPEWVQPPMFIYGKYNRFGDALNSLLKGDSINLRPYKELYY